MAKSAWEAESMANDKVRDLVERVREFLEELKYSQEKKNMLVDSSYAMKMVKQVTGSFKMAKHIKMQLFC